MQLRRAGRSPMTSGAGESAGIQPSWGRPDAKSSPKKHRQGNRTPELQSADRKTKTEQDLNNRHVGFACMSPRNSELRDVLAAVATLKAPGR